MKARRNAVDTAGEKTELSQAGKGRIYLCSIPRCRLGSTAELTSYVLQIVEIYMLTIAESDWLTVAPV